MATKYRFIQSDVSVVLQGTLDPDPLADPAAVYVETVHAPPTTFVAPFMYDDTPSTGGLHGWDGTEYISVGSPAPPAAALQLLGTVVNVATAPFDVSGISQAFNDLIFVLIARGDGATDDEFARVQFNNDSGAHYDYVYLLNTSGSQSAGATFGLCAYMTAASAGANKFGSAELVLPGYTSTARQKTMISNGGEGGSTQALIQTAVTWTATPAAVTRVKFFPASGTGYVAGSELRIYGRL
jgi:hypothetical protein